MLLKESSGSFPCSTAQGKMFVWYWVPTAVIKLPTQTLHVSTAPNQFFPARAVPAGTTLSSSFPSLEAPPPPSFPLHLEPVVVKRLPVGGVRRPEDEVGRQAEEGEELGHVPEELLLLQAPPPPLPVVVDEPPLEDAVDPQVQHQRGRDAVLVEYLHEVEHALVRHPDGRAEVRAGPSREAPVDAVQPKEAEGRAQELELADHHGGPVELLLVERPDPPVSKIVKKYAAFARSTLLPTGIRTARMSLATCSVKRPFKRAKFRPIRTNTGRSSPVAVRASRGAV